MSPSSSQISAAVSVVDVDRVQALVANGVINAQLAAELVEHTRTGANVILAGPAGSPVAGALLGWLAAHGGGGVCLLSDSDGAAVNAPTGVRLLHDDKLSLGELLRAGREKRPEHIFANAIDPSLAYDLLLAWSCGYAGSSACLEVDRLAYVLPKLVHLATQRGDMDCDGCARLVGATVNLIAFCDDERVVEVVQVIEPELLGEEAVERFALLREQGDSREALAGIYVLPLYGRSADGELVCRHEALSRAV